MSKDSPTYRQGTYLRHLGHVLGEFIDWEDIEVMTKYEASIKIAELEKRANKK